jgi:uncharacterized protein
MPIARILVDGYSLLHGWPELAPGKARFSSAAREELIHRLMLYRDAIGTPISLVFDGAGPAPDASQVPSTPEMEIIYSRAGQTADQLIERVAAMMKPYGEVLVITDDHAERDTVLSMGGMASSCLSFISDVENTLQEFDRGVEHHNARERNRFNSKGN